MPSATINPSQMQPTLQGIADSTGAEVVFKSNCFEVHGLEGQVRAAVGYVLELDVIKVSQSPLIRSLFSSVAL
jgi:hypothetical protein